MRSLLFLTLYASGALAGAPDIRNCDEATWHDTAATTPCRVSAAAMVVQPQAPEPSPDAAAIHEIAAKALLQAHRRELAESLQMRRLLKHSDERVLGQYQENRERCEKALLIAALCGSNARAFYCNARGFSMSPTAVSGGAVPVALNRQDPYDIEQCASHAAMGALP